jgi:DNA-binding PadR family transcriptional regulator
MSSNPYRTLTPLALVVLELLTERAMHPYEMQQLIRERHTDQVVKVRAGSLYHTVERLQRAGLIEAVETGREGRRPERTVYQLTEAGRDQFHANLRELVRTPETEYPLFGVAVEMLGKLTRSEAVDLLSRRAVQLEARLAGGEQVLATLAKGGLPRIYTIDTEYLMAMCRAELSWVRQLVDEIGSGDLPWSVRVPPKHLTRPKHPEEERHG